VVVNLGNTLRRSLAVSNVSHRFGVESFRPRGLPLDGTNTVTWVHKSVMTLCMRWPDETILKLDEDVILCSEQDRWNVGAGQFLVPNLTINDFTTRWCLERHWPGPRRADRRELAHVALSSPRDRRGRPSGPAACHLWHRSRRAGAQHGRLEYVVDYTIFGHHINYWSVREYLTRNQPVVRACSHRVISLSDGDQPAAWTPPLFHVDAA